MGEGWKGDDGVATSYFKELFTDGKVQDYDHVLSGIQ